jgi:hypothetical protein
MPSCLCVTPQVYEVDFAARAVNITFDQGFDLDPMQLEAQLTLGLESQLPPSTEMLGLCSPIDETWSAVYRGLCPR